MTHERHLSRFECDPLDGFEDDPVWFEWSVSALEQYANSSALCINPIVYSEVSAGFNRIEELERALAQGEFEFRQIPKETLFLAGKVFLQYRTRAGEDFAIT